MASDIRSSVKKLGWEQAKATEKQGYNRQIIR